jgi:hypothetical protein
MTFGSIRKVFFLNCGLVFELTFRDHGDGVRLNK